MAGKVLPLSFIDSEVYPCGFSSGGDVVAMVETTKPESMEYCERTALADCSPAT